MGAGWNTGTVRVARHPEGVIELRLGDPDQGNALVCAPRKPYLVPPERLRGW